jgi:hypothetical protein
MPPGQPSVFFNQIGCADEVRPPGPDEALSTIAGRDDRRISVESLTFAVIAALTVAWVGGAHFVAPLLGNGAVRAIVERIVAVESSGDSNAKNTRSSATGAGQFLDETWLELIGKYRPDLVQGRSEKEILELRRDPELARAIITRLVEQNAAMLKKRGLPVTPGTLYLTHFAGAAGAVAVLSGSESANAASLMASADATGRTTREKLRRASTGGPDRRGLEFTKIARCRPCAPPSRKAKADGMLVSEFRRRFWSFEDGTLEPVLS